MPQKQHFTRPGAYTEDADGGGGVADAGGCDGGGGAAGAGVCDGGVGAEDAEDVCSKNPDVRNTPV